ncbi:MAG: hypothetical protein FJZ64_01615 [Chlamydiae bacterium]|nr:hypothetical protein [Chlamydiota bacterium]
MSYRGNMPIEDASPTKTVKIGEDIPPKPVPIPESIGPYKIESLFKKGGMSLLYLAKHPTTSETVIVKVILPKYLKSKEMVTRLIREAKILSIASHPNIVRLYDLGRWEDGLYVVMEFIQAISLRQFIKTQSLTHRRALEIILQIAYAMAHLHSQNIVHRDLKPDNVLITESGAIKLIDFGISMFVETPDADHRTEKKARLGTPQYMSPEQREAPNKVSFNTDIFPLGIMTYELFLGRQSHGVVQTSLLPKTLRIIVEKALQIDPAKRYQDVVDFISDISAYLKTFDLEKGEAPIEEMAQEVIRSILLPQTAPSWSEAEIGLAIRKGPLYLDFLPFLPQRLGIVLATCEKENDEALFRLPMLRGMIQMAMKDPSLTPTSLVERLNRALADDPHQTAFHFALLFLDAENQSLSYISCGLGSLWHYPENQKKPRVLTTDNPSLGKDRGFTFSELKETWRPEDLLLFSSFPMDISNAKELEEKLLLSSQPLADAVLAKTLKDPIATGVSFVCKNY